MVYFNGPVCITTYRRRSTHENPFHYLSELWAVHRAQLVCLFFICNEIDFDTVSLNVFKKKPKCVVVKLPSKNPIRTVEVEIVHSFSQSIFLSIFFSYSFSVNEMELLIRLMLNGACIMPLANFTFVHPFPLNRVQWHPHFSALNMENSFQIGTIVNYPAAQLKLYMKRVKLGTHQSLLSRERELKKKNRLQSIKLMNKLNRNDNDDRLYSHHLEHMMRAIFNFFRFWVGYQGLCNAF